MISKSIHKNAIRKMGAISFIQASSSTAFAVFFSGLSLFLTQQENYTKEAATTFTGLFLSLNYCLPLIGGMIAGRLLSYKKLYCLGISFNIIGSLLLAIHANLHAGLAFFLMSSLVTNVCVNMFITTLYDSNQIIERRVAFIWNYTAMNFGFLAGYFLTGYSTIYNSYSILFFLIAGLMFFSLLFALIFINENSYKSNIKISNIKSVIATLIIMLALISIIFLIFKHAYFSKKYFMIAALLVLSGMLCYGFKNSEFHERKKLIQFIGYSALSIIFWSMYMLTPTAILQLIENNVARAIFGITLAPQWLVNIDSIVILALAPLFAFFLNNNKLNNNKLNVLNYYQFSFTALAIAFLFLYAGFHHLFSNHMMPMWSMLSYLILMTIGEIFISPIGNALIGELIPEKMRPLMTGAWSMNIGIGSLIASMIANLYILPYVQMGELTAYNSLKLQNITMILGMMLFAFSIIILMSNKCLNQKMAAKLLVNKGKYENN